LPGGEREPLPGRTIEGMDPGNEKSGNLVKEAPLEETRAQRNKDSKRTEGKAVRGGGVYN